MGWLVAQPIERWISPSATDPSINRWDQPHYVVLDTNRPLQGRLMVWLPGSFGRPDHYRYIVGEAAAIGLHAIGLTYPNSWTVAALCRNDVDSMCHEKVRREIFDGIDRTYKVNVAPSNSIQNRLLKLLQYLHIHYPLEGWNAYYTPSDSIRWDRIVMGGHSQGGGHAAMVGRLHRVDRCLMFGWTDIWDGRLAPWQLAPRQTPPEAYFGFTHHKDLATVRVFLWQAWQLPGSPVVVDTLLPPYNGSHQLLTSVTPSRIGAYHGSVAVDNATPLDDQGRPLLAPVWRYMIGDSVVSSLPAVGGEPISMVVGTDYVRFFLPHGSRLRMEVLDFVGRHIYTLADQYFAAGYHRIQYPALRHRPVIIRIIYDGKMLVQTAF